MLFIGHTIRRLFHQNALSFVTIWRAVFYVDNALMIISWKIDVGSIQMQNIILYVVAVCSSHTPFFFTLISLFFFHWVPMSQHDVILKCSRSIMFVWSLSITYGEKKPYQSFSVQDWTGSTSNQYFTENHDTST